MPAPALIALVSIAYLGLLFAIAFYADKRADAGRSVIASPYVYALSLGVYATSWTFYGSVGRAASNGVGFLPIYLGPTLAAALFWLVLRKIVRISRENRITSIADFIASRYGKSAALAGIVTVIAVIGIIPYIALQLKAVSGSFLLLAQRARGGAARSGRRRSAARRHRVLRRARARGLRHPVRRAASGRRRTPRGDGRGDRLRVGRQARRLSRHRAVRHVRPLRWVRRPVRPRRGGSAARTPARAVRRAGREVTRAGPGCSCSRRSRSCACRGSSRWPSSRTSTSPTSQERAGSSRCTCSRSICSCCRSHSAGCSTSPAAPWTPTPSSSPCRSPKGGRCSRSRCFSVVCRPRPGW